MTNELAFVYFLAAESASDYSDECKYSELAVGKWLLRCSAERCQL